MPKFLKLSCAAAVTLGFPVLTCSGYLPSDDFEKWVKMKLFFPPGARLDYFYNRKTRLASHNIMK